MNSIKIEVSHPEFKMISESILKNRIEVIIKELIPQWLQYWEFSLWITTNGEIRSLNRTRRNIDRPTDVLSFPLLDLNTPLPIQILGEVVISWDRTMEQAKEIGHTEEDEFYRLLVHGILHLFGYDHEISTADEKIMKAKEDEILTLILGEGVWD